MDFKALVILFTFICSLSLEIKLLANRSRQQPSPRFVKLTDNTERMYLRPEKILKQYNRADEAKAIYIVKNIKNCIACFSPVYKLVNSINKTKVPIYILNICDSNTNSIRRISAEDKFLFCDSVITLYKFRERAVNDLLSNDTVFNHVITTTPSIVLRKKNRFLFLNNQDIYYNNLLNYSLISESIKKVFY